jgi:hypothetical protein
VVGVHLLGEETDGAGERDEFVERFGRFSDPAPRCLKNARLRRRLDGASRGACRRMCLLPASAPTRRRRHPHRRAKGTAPLGTVESTHHILSTAALTSMVMLGVGIAAVGGEYRHGTNVTTFLVTPRRRTSC